MEGTAHNDIQIKTPPTGLAILALVGPGFVWVAGYIGSGEVILATRTCAILIGDTRKAKHFVPLAFNVMLRFLKVGFILKEDIIKVQHHCRFTQHWRLKARRDRFYLIMHEHLFVFRKRTPGENLSRLQWSRSIDY